MATPRIHEWPSNMQAPQDAQQFPHQPGLEELLLALREDDRCAVRDMVLHMQVAGFPPLVRRAVARVVLEMDWHETLAGLLAAGWQAAAPLTTAGENMLHFACFFGAHNCIQLLLQHSAPLADSRDAAGRTPLMAWVRHNADLGPATSSGGPHGGTAILRAAPSVCDVDHRGRTALIHAADGSTATSAAVAALLDAVPAEQLKDHVNHAGSLGETALSRAIRGHGLENERVVAVLLKAGAHVTAAHGLHRTVAAQGAGVDSAGLTESPLQVAIIRSRPAVTAQLLAAQLAVAPELAFQRAAGARGVNMRLEGVLSDIFGSHPLDWALTAVQRNGASENAAWLQSWLAGARSIVGQADCDDETQHTGPGETPCDLDAGTAGSEDAFDMLDAGGEWGSDDDDDKLPEGEAGSAEFSAVELGELQPTTRSLIPLPPPPRAVAVLQILGRAWSSVHFRSRPPQAWGEAQAQAVALRCLTAWQESQQARARTAAPSNTAAERRKVELEHAGALPVLGFEAPRETLPGIAAAMHAADATPVAPTPHSSLPSDPVGFSQTGGEAFSSPVGASIVARAFLRAEVSWSARKQAVMWRVAQSPSTP